MYEIIFYEDEKNKSPVWDYMENLRKSKDSNKTARIEYNQMVLSIEMLKKEGTKNPANITKKLDEDLWELRPGNNRILYFTYIENKFVLLHHFRKKTQKMPEREIEQAKREIKDFLKREGEKMKTWEDYKAMVKADNKDDAEEMELMEALAELLTEYVRLREERGISQSELAELAGVKQSAISRLESLKSVPQIDTMLRLLKPLGYKLQLVRDNS